MNVQLEVHSVVRDERHSVNATLNCICCEIKVTHKCTQNAAEDVQNTMARHIHQVRVEGVTKGRSPWRVNLRLNLSFDLDEGRLLLVEHIDGITDLRQLREEAILRGFGFRERGVEGKVDGLLLTMVVEEYRCFLGSNGFMNLRRYKKGESRFGILVAKVDGLDLVHLGVTG